jgi:hypothetical protein
MHELVYFVFPLSWTFTFLEIQAFKYMQDIIDFILCYDTISVTICNCEVSSNE